MSWARLDDVFPTHPKVVAAGGDAAWLHVCALCYCAEHLTDGLVPKNMLGRLSDRKKPEALARRLIECDLWSDEGDSYRLHDYLEYNPSRERVEKDRAAARERRAKGGRTSPDVRANDINPDPTRPLLRDSEPAPQARRRGSKSQRDALFDALVDAFGLASTSSRKGLYGKVVTELIGAEATPAQVTRRARQMETNGWKDASPTALAKHWDALASSNGRAPTVNDYAAGTY